MGLEHLKRWHWVVIGALVGVALGYAWASLETNVEGLRTAEARDFERDVVLKHNASGKPLISGIVIHPPEEAFDGMVNIVTYKRLAQDRQGRLGWMNIRLVTKIPYQPVYRPVRLVKRGQVDFPIPEGKKLEVGGQSVHESRRECQAGPAAASQQAAFEVPRACGHRRRPRGSPYRTIGRPLEAAGRWRCRVT